MPEQKTFQAPGIDLQGLAEALAQWFQGQSFAVQVLRVPAGGYAVQARKDDFWRTTSGLAAALNVTLNSDGDTLIVETGAAKWVDKAMLGVISAIIFWPTLALPAYGTFKQKQLVDKTLQFIARYVSERRATVAATKATPVQSPSAELRCPRCNRILKAGDRFCGTCRASLVFSCPQCGASLRPAARFCDSCGAAV